MSSYFIEYLASTRDGTDLGKEKNLFPLKRFELRIIRPLFWSHTKYAILTQSSSGKLGCCILFFNFWL